MSESETIVKVKSDEKTKKQPRYNVILMNDDFHTFDYVVLMCRQVFGYPPEKGHQIAEEVDKQGRCIVWGPGALEVAELKQELIHSVGKDPNIKDCKGSMTAVLEPVD